MNIAITGSHGLLGQFLSHSLALSGHRVFPVLRKRTNRPEALFWDGEEVDATGFRSMDAVVHLAGENLFGPWTSKKKKEIRRSRVHGTRVLAQGLASLAPLVRPDRFLCASATGFYGDRGEEQVTEHEGAGSGFLAQVCRDWEEATGDLERAGVSVTQMRFGVVMAQDGGFLKMVSPIAGMGLAAPVGEGKQWMSWIALSDLARAVEFLLDRPLEGPVNLTSPQPVRQSVMMEEVARSRNAHTHFRVPRTLARWVGGEMAEEMLLSSCRAIPRRLLNAGFVFHCRNLPEILAQRDPAPLFTSPPALAASN